ncbi:AraC family transcriptional regulator [Paenibacillaceae bacterium]|nr:AraC family transcriptional regulator [Paenibacillaceae bacterium]
MDWETHIERWSRAAVTLLDICQYGVENGTLPDRYVAHTSFFLVTAHGEARVSLAGTVYEARPLHILHGGKEAELSFMPLGNDYACYLILYKANCELPEDRETFHMSYGFTPYAMLPLQEKCQTMNRLWQQATPMDRLQAQSTFLPFVYEVMRQLRASAEDNSRPNLIAEAIHYIHEHYREPITTEQLVGIYGCSVSYLSRMFKSQIGAGTIEYLIYVRIHKAKQHLLKTEARILEIAGSVGYADVYYFRRLFKKHTGCSPLQFREEKRNSVHNNPLRLLKSPTF